MIYSPYNVNKCAKATSIKCLVFLTLCTSWQVALKGDDNIQKIWEDGLTKKPKIYNLFTDFTRKTVKHEPNNCYSNLETEYSD